MTKLTNVYSRYRHSARTGLLTWTRAGFLGAVLTSSLFGANEYLVHNLVSDLPGMADHVDPNLVNPWGNAFSATSPFWIGNNHSGTSTLYDGTGTAIPLVVKIPTPADPNGQGAPTGVLFNGTTAFAAPNGKVPTFMFCTEDGTIAGWYGGLTTALILVDNSPAGAVYKGCAIGGTSAAPWLYAADFHNGRIDVWGRDLKPVPLSPFAFADPVVPAGFAPFNIVNLGGKLYVTYAKQDDEKMDDVAGVGNGYVAVFDMNGGPLMSTFISGVPLNSPWGMAIAPSTFGDFAGKLLVGNFGDGLIHAFDPSTGVLAGTLNDTTGKPIAILGLWSLLFGNGGRGGDPQTLYFTAGIPGPDAELESHGLFGSIQAAPSFQASQVVNAASHFSTIAPNTWVSILGGGLSATTRTWGSADFVNNALPTQLDDVGVTLNGTPAYVDSISPTQITFLVPSSLAPGPVQIQTTNHGLASATETAVLSPVAPALFFLQNTKYLWAQHAADSALIGTPNLISGNTTTPAHPGETIILYGTGFGATNPAVPDGQLVTTALNLVTPPTITIGGQPAQVLSAALTGAGLYTFWVVVPAGLPAGNATVIARLPGAQSELNALIPVALQ